jgi:hypothetical protein
LVAPANGAYWGISADNVPNGHETLTSWTKTHGGLRPQLVQWFQQWRSGETGFHLDWVKAIAAQGAIPFITWEPWAKPPGRYADPKQPESQLHRILDGVDDSYIRSWAKAAAAYRGPILLRFMQELNGYWYPWSIGVNGNTPAQSAAAWRHVHDIFVEEHATNVSWVWSVTAFVPGTAPESELLAAYPGRAYVDWVGVSVINWGSAFNAPWLSPQTLLDPTYRVLATLDKPIMVSEVGSSTQGGDQAAWLNAAMVMFQREMPDVKAVVWLDRLVEADLRLRPDTTQALVRLAHSPWWRAPLQLSRS